MVTSYCVHWFYFGILIGSIAWLLAYIWFCLGLKRKAKKVK